MLLKKTDEDYMKSAIQEAVKAMDEGEVPVGVVIVYENKIIARAHNRVEIAVDATAHGEILAIGSASEYLKTWRLDGCILYTTLEPCPMCAGAIINSRITKIVYGADDKRLGACGSAANLFSIGLLNRKTEVIGGVMEEDCSMLMKSFFQELRQKKDE